MKLIFQTIFKQRNDDRFRPTTEMKETVKIGCREK